MTSALERDERSAVCGAGGADAYLVIARDEVGEQLGYDRHDHIRVA